MLGALGVEKDPRQRLEQDYLMGSWTVPGAVPRPVVVRERGVPDWWEGPEQASQSFLQSMGVQL